MPAAVSPCSGQGRPAARLACVLWVAWALLPCGCAALTNPVASGIPVRHVPEELLAHSKEGEQTIPLTLLGQCRPTVYRLAPGDVLAVYLEGFLGSPNLPLPVQTPALIQQRDWRKLPASAGYPVTVQGDGTIDLPVVGPLPVAGLSVAQAREAVRQVYARRKLIGLDRPGVLVSLLQPRYYSVLVLRQENTSFAVGPESQVTAGIAKRGAGFEIDLPAYENDVLHALARSGGLPGLDALDAITVYRTCFQDPSGRGLLMQQMQQMRADADPVPALCPTSPVVHIPLRTPAGKPPCIHPEDVLLHDGDVVFIEARENQFFYTAGLLPPGAHVLPRDHDLDVIEAVTLVRGPILNGDFGGSNLSGAFIQTGLGFPSPTLLSVVRRTPGGGQVVIKVDLGKAFHDPSERLLVRAGDVLVLQEKPSEALARWFGQTMFNFDLFWRPINTKVAQGVVDVAAPDRLNTGRVGIVDVTQPGPGP
jgi:protein involved in polysaccharide export with SLBB domain